MKLFYQSIIILFLAFSSSVIASELTAPKKAGIIGERFDGYVGIIKNASPEIKALVKNVNNKRKERYKAIAKKRKQSLQTVQQIAGESALKKTVKGNYIFLKSKGWVKK
ncbi:YdbL family protein [Aliikangiella coralliicola]|nr:YdbL family protein [Aliikangiella coralliicola]